MSPARQAVRICVAIAALFVAQAFASDGLPRPAEDYFGEFAYCALILSRNRHREALITVGPTQCRLPLSPCSTFKIPNALIGLQTGVVTGPDDLKRWDGTTHRREAQNRNHTLQSAISASIPWYFQSLARDVGEERMAAWLKRLDYGNQDISAGIDRFWLGSSLKINANQQMELIKNLWHRRLPFDPAHQQALAKMLVLDSSLDGVLHGKTGSCTGTQDPATPDHGWFIGWVDWNSPAAGEPDTSFFVINTTGPNAWGSQAKRITLEILQDMQQGAKPTHLTE